MAQAAVIFVTISEEGYARTQIQGRTIFDGETRLYYCREESRVQAPLRQTLRQWMALMKLLGGEEELFSSLRSSRRTTTIRSDIDPDLVAYVTNASSGKKDATNWTQNEINSEVALFIRLEELHCGKDGDESLWTYFWPISGVLGRIVGEEERGGDAVPAGDDEGDKDDVRRNGRRRKECWW